MGVFASYRRQELTLSCSHYVLCLYKRYVMFTLCFYKRYMPQCCVTIHCESLSHFSRVRHIKMEIK